MKTTYWLRRARSRLRGLLSRQTVEREMDEEMRFHLRMRAEENARRGMAPEEAERSALRSFGSLTRVKEAARDMKGGGVIETVWQDARYAARTLRKSPGFTLVAVMTLALGVGANTAIFSVVNAVLLRPLPYAAPDRLVTMRSNQSLPDLEDIRAQSRSFEALGAANGRALDYTGEAEPLQVQASLVNADLFSALGVPAEIGRVITPEEDRYGGEQVVVLGHDFWQLHFGGDPSVLGRKIPLSGNSYTVVGVMPRKFNAAGEEIDVWAALRVVDPLASQFRGVHFLRTYLRLRPGVTLQQAQSEMEAIDQRLEREHPDENKGRRRRLVSLHEFVVGDVRPALLVLFGAVGLVLLIAAANFSNLLLARMAARRPELAIRAALGAGRGRLARQLVTESVLLAALGGAVGVVLASWGIKLLTALKPESLPLPAPVEIDRWVLAFTFGVALLTGALFSLLPALGASLSDATRALNDAGRGGTGGARRRVRGMLVVAELALALMLLVGAGLLIGGFLRLRSVAPGIDPNNLLTVRVELPEARYKEIPKQTEFRRQLLERLNSLPGVEAAMVSELPLSGDFLTHNFLIEGRPLAAGDEPELYVRSVGGDYFRTMRIPLLRGRGLAPQDREGAPAVGVVNESFVRQYFPDSDPVGARIRWARQEPPAWMTIVGVVGDVRQFGLDQPEAPAFYYSYMQSDQPWKRWTYLAVRGRADQSALARQVKEQVWALDRQLPVTKVKSMTEVIGSSVAARRFNMTLMGVFAAAALLLACLGIYGVVSYTVAQRTREIGVRLALGAQRRDVLRMVLRQGMLLASLGVALGLAGALALTRVMASMLYGIAATDPPTYVAGALLLLLVTFFACLVPALRATKVDPLIALRAE